MSKVTNDDYLALCEKYEFFNQVGFEGFETKVWLIFKALTDGTVSEASVSKSPCQSLMQNGVPFSSIQNYLKELNQNRIFSVYGQEFSLRPEQSYELHRICFEITSKITHPKFSLQDLIVECGYVYDDENRNLVFNFENGDINDKTNTFKDLMTQLAFAGAKLLIKVVVHIEEKM